MSLEDAVDRCSFLLHGYYSALHVLELFLYYSISSRQIYVTHNHVRNSFYLMKFNNCPSRSVWQLGGAVLCDVVLIVFPLLDVLEYSSR